jgi:hypothetical protein
MASIVLELQRDSLNASTPVSDLLRKALVIAAKLNVPDINTWIENELNSYNSADDLPPYRTVTGQVMAQDYWGRWIPVSFPDSHSSKLVSTARLVDSAAELEALVQNNVRENAGSLSIDFTPEQEAILARVTQGEPTKHTRFIRVEDIKGVLDAVRTQVLKWSLKLEKDGILGEGMTFSQHEREKAAAVHYTSNFYSQVGNVAQHSSQVNQTANIGIQPPELGRLVAEMSDHLAELALDGLQRQKAETQIATLRAQLVDPDPVIVQQAGRTLRNVTEGAIASLLATAAQPAVWHGIQQLLSHFC